MNRETRQRIEVAKKIIRKQPLSPEEREIKRRKTPYHYGAKDFLASMEIGEEKQHDEKLSWRGLQCAACYLRRDYGSMYTFRKINGIRTIIRIR